MPELPWRTRQRAQQEKKAADGLAASSLAAWVAAAIAVAALGLTGYGVWLGRDTQKRQLRPYLSIEFPERDIRRDENGRRYLAYQVRNRGLTAATNVRRGRVSGFTTINEQFIPFEVKVTDQAAVVYPGDTSARAAVPIENTLRLYETQLPNAQRLFFIRARYEYEDSFDQRYALDVCYLGVALKKSEGASIGPCRRQPVVRDVRLSR